MKALTGGYAWGLGGLGVLGLLAYATMATQPALQEMEPEAAPAASGTGGVALAEPLPHPDTERVLEARAELHSVIPEYPRAVSVPLGQLEANGNPVNLVAFHTADAPEQVASWYAAEFRRTGRVVTTQADPQGAGLSVTYYDSERGVMVGVAALPLPRPKGQPPLTLGLPSLTRVQQGVLLRAEAPRDFPAAANSVTVLRLDDKTPGPTDGSQTLVNMVPGRTRAVAEQYLRALADKGYSVVSQQARQGTEVMEFQGDRERVKLTVSPTGTAAEEESLVTVIRERAREEGRP